MGAFPVAMSKLVSSYNSKGNIERVNAFRQGSKKLFLITGLIGMTILLVFAKPYSILIAKSPKALYTILVLAPSVLFSSLSASYRGYFEGLLDMLPTAISQTIEALFKMVFGLLFARLSMSYLLEQYIANGAILGSVAPNEEVAFSIIYPITSAFAMLGVTLGSFVSLCFLWVYSAFKTDRIKPNNTKEANRELIAFSFPIIVSTCVQSVFQFLDTATIQYAINMVELSSLKTMYSNCLEKISIMDKDLPTYAFGLYSSSLDFKNLVPGITMALGVSAVPAISRAFEQKNKDKFDTLINSIFKYTFLLSSLGGLALYFCSDEILNIFYGASSPDIVIGTNRLIKLFALTVPIYSLAGISVFSVQAIGLPKKSIPSYVVSGIIRVLLNIILVSRNELILYGAVISGAVSYLVLVLWNMAILVRYTHLKFSYFKVIFLPLMANFMCYMINVYLIKYVCFFENITVLVTIKLLIVTFSYCILCFLCRMQNFREFFRDFDI